MEALIKVRSELEDLCFKLVTEQGTYSFFNRSIAVTDEYINAIHKYYKSKDKDLITVTNKACHILIHLLQLRELVGHDQFDSTLENLYKHKLER